MLDLQELENISDFSEIKSKLSPESDGTYHIYIPKSTQEYFSDSEAIGTDYAQLAFSGQKLSSAAKEFTYEFVSPQEHESVLFILRDVDEDMLTSTLLELSYYYGFNDTEDEEDYSYMDIDQFVSDVNNDVVEAVCPDFIEVSNDFFNRDQDTEDE